MVCSEAATESPCRPQYKVLHIVPCRTSFLLCGTVTLVFSSSIQHMSWCCAALTCKCICKPPRIAMATVLCTVKVQDCAVMATVLQHCVLSQGLLSQTGMVCYRCGMG